MYRLAGFGVPDNGSFPLIGDAYGCYVLAVYAYLGDGLGYDRGLGRPYLHRIVLDPAGLGEMLGEFHLGCGTDVAVVIENNCARGAGALVNRKDILVHFEVF